MVSNEGAPIAFMFPGQASQYPGMFARALAAWPDGDALIDEASEVLGWSLRDHYLAPHPDMFARNRYVQVGVFVVNHLYMEALHAHGIRADVSLGLSLGEYNHLVHIGALTFRDALELVHERGRLYEDAPFGAMMAVHPIDRPALDDLIQRARAHGFVAVANCNSPTNFVVAGEPAALEELAAWAEAECFATTQPIDQRLPMHSELFSPVADPLRRALRRATWRAPRLPYVSNLLGAVVLNDGPVDFPAILSEHVRRPVLWSAALQTVRQRYGVRQFVEVGPKKTLCSLLRRNLTDAVGFACDAGTSLDTLAREVRVAA